MWKQRGDRRMRCTLHYVGYCDMVCPDTPSIPEQHNRWLLMWQDDPAPCFGVFGDDTETVAARATEYIRARLVETVQAMGQTVTVQAISKDADWDE